MAGYTPLFGSIVRSSIWDEDAKTCKVWITLLALADAEGYVEGSFKGLAHEARVSLSECNTALNILKSPDPYSKTADNDGRRIEEVEGGWLILNHALYRKKAKSRAEYYRNWRAKKKISPNPLEKEITKTYTHTQTGATNATVAQRNATFSLQQCKDACIMLQIPESNAESYFHHYNSQGWRKANDQGITNLQSHMHKRWNKVLQCWDFDEKKFDSSGKESNQGKTKLFPIKPARSCGKCQMPAVHKVCGAYGDFFYCWEHIPPKLKAQMEETYYV